MVGHTKILILLLCLTLPLAACLKLKQPQNKIEYYTLEYDPPASGQASGPAVCHPGATIFRFPCL